MAKKVNTKVNGKEYYRIRRKVGEDADGHAIMKAFYGEGKKEAEEKYMQYLKDMEATPNGNRNDSLGKIAKFYTYQVMLNENLAPGSIELYERAYRVMFAPSKLATRPIKDISGSDIQKFLNDLATGTLDGNHISVTPSSLLILVYFMRKFFKYVAVEGYCRNLMENITTPKVAAPSGEKKEIQVFTEDEIARIISTPGRLSFLAQLALATGLRRGELLALEYSDFENGCVNVTKQLQYTYKVLPDGSRERVGIIKKPKSASSIRTVPVPENVLQALARHEKWHREEMMKNGYRTNYVFTTSSGHLISSGAHHEMWRSYLKRARVPYKKFHACRATYCTMLCKRGVRLETASQLIGHADINITAGFYRFVGAEELGRAVTEINDLFAIEN